MTMKIKMKNQDKDVEKGEAEKEGEFAEDDYDKPVNNSVFPLDKGKTLFLFGSTNPFRITCGHIVSHDKFDQGILVLIIISSLLLAVDNPLNDPSGPVASILTFYR